jgi:hypothetical protein
MQQAADGRAARRTCGPIIQRRCFGITRLQRGRRKERGQAVSDISIGVASVRFWLVLVRAGGEGREGR